MPDMTDEQFRALRTLILDLKVEIKELSVTVRSLERRVASLEAKVGDVEPALYSTDDLIPVLKIPRSREPRSDSE
jgi:hypothetical protein